MDYTGAGLAALGVLGPGIGIGILGGMAATAIGTAVIACATACSLGTTEAARTSSTGTATPDQAIVLVPTVNCGASPNPTYGKKITVFQHHGRRVAIHTYGALAGLALTAHTHMLPETVKATTR